MSFCRSAADSLCTSIALGATAAVLVVRTALAAPPEPDPPDGASAPAAGSGGEAVEPERAAPETARAQPRQSAPSRRELDEARQHFETALKSYSEGRYRAAIDELQKARRLDPRGKDLVYNLALVHEKLGELATALAYFDQYLAMETDENERARTKASIVRLRGAMREAEREHAEPPSKATLPPFAPPPAMQGRRGVLDGWVWASGGLALTALLVGTVLGVRALALDPGQGEATGSGRSVDDVRDDSHRAHRSAVAADIAFAISLTSGAAGSLLYFGRALPQPEARPAEPSPSPPRASASIDIGVRF